MTHERRDEGRRKMSFSFGWEERATPVELALVNLLTACENCIVHVHLLKNLV
jgi:hypothetical protein